MTASRWADLRIRLASGLVLIVIGSLETYWGGTAFLLAVVVFFAAMIWELAGLTADTPEPARLILTLGAALCLASVAVLPPAAMVLLAVPSLGLLLTPRRDRALLALYALAIMAAGIGFVELRLLGAGVFLWMVAVVVVCDTLGYFAGRTLGGPKFWPAISPKKTWSGTVAGWFGATGVGVVFAALGVLPWPFVALSPVVAFAGQLGDIAESWIKRRAGVKDSSRLIPGHGGVLDRFDALVGAVLAVQAFGHFMTWVG